MNLLVIGMTFDAINPLIEIGHLTNIARLVRKGALAAVQRLFGRRRKADYPGRGYQDGPGGR